MFKPRPKYDKLRTSLNLAIQRLKLLEKKKTELALKARKEIADYIQAGKEDRARIRVEHIVREDYLVEGMEIIESYCDCLVARFGLIKSFTRVDEELDKPLANIIWASVRLQHDIPELKEITKQLTAKYGQEYVDMCRRSDCDSVDERLKHKLSLHSPPKILIEKYMIEVARYYNVHFEPDPLIMMDGVPSVSQDLIDLGVGGGEKRFPPPGGPGSGSGPGSGGGHFPVATAQQPVAPVPSYPPNQSPYPQNDMAYPPAAPTCPPPSVNVGYEPQRPGPFQQPTNPNPHSGGSVPPLPRAPPSGGQVNRPPGGGGVQYPREPSGTSGGHLPSYDTAINQPPPYNGSNATNLPNPPPGPPKVENSVLDLPSVPNKDLSSPGNSIGASAGGEDVDFDDLTRRFEELKKRK